MLAVQNPVPRHFLHATIAMGTSLTSDKDERGLQQAQATTLLVIAAESREAHSVQFTWWAARVCEAPPLPLSPNLFSFAVLHCSPGPHTAAWHRPTTVDRLGCYRGRSASICGCLGGGCGQPLPRQVGLSFEFVAPPYRYKHNPTSKIDKIDLGRLKL